MRLFFVIFHHHVLKGVWGKESEAGKLDLRNHYSCDIAVAERRSSQLNYGGLPKEKWIPHMVCKCTE